MPVELLIVSWMRKKAREGRAREDGDRIIFSTVLLARLVAVSAVLVLAFVETLLFSDSDPWWQQLALLSILLFLLSQWPGAVIIDSTGVSKRTFLGVRRTIPWQDVRTLDLEARKQQAHVGKGTGLRMTFTSFHVDLQRFVQEIRRRAPGANFTSDL